MSKNKKNSQVIKKIAGPVQGMRWNVLNGAFVLQMAKEAVVFENGKFLRMETVWQDVPIVDAAETTEPSTREHITTAKLLEG